jgi:hypothetical protein
VSGISAMMANGRDILSVIAVAAAINTVAIGLTQ